MQIVGLFAGIGGLEVGFGQAGHKTVMASEILPAARAVLEHRLPDTEHKRKRSQVGNSDLGQLVRSRYSSPPNTIASPITATAIMAYG